MRTLPERTSQRWLPYKKIFYLNSHSLKMSINCAQVVAMDGQRHDIILLKYQATKASRSEYT